MIEPELLEQVAKVLKAPAEAIRTFDEERAIYNISCNFSDNAVNNNAVNIQHINTAEKWLEALEENKKLYAALLKEKDEKILLLEKLLGNQADKK